MQPPTPTVQGERLSELLTFITAIAPYHISIAERALASIRAQTIPVHMLYEVDADSTGPAVVRNRLLNQVTTPFVAFVDADDWLEPDWSAETLAAYEPARYVYTDHWQGDTAYQSGERAFISKLPDTDSYTWHPITTLLPTEAARQVRFREDMPGGEDTAFYLGLMALGICGKWLRKPLFHYGEGGKRGLAFYRNPERYDILLSIWQQLGDKAMSCCNDKPAVEYGPVGIQQPGDILAQSLWEGNRVERGTITGRMYPRTGNGKMVWINASDVAARPDLFRAVETIKPPSTPQAVPPSVLLEQARRKAEEANPPAPHGVAEVAAKVFGAVVNEPVITVEELTAKQPAPKRPDVKEVQRRTRKAKK